MADRALRKCSTPGCRTLHRNAGPKCDQHASERQPWSRSKQSAVAQTLYGWRWAKASRRFLAAHPLCVECQRQGRTTAAECTDHVIPHRGDETLFWNEGNWQPLCREHHQAKTLRGE